MVGKEGDRAFQRLDTASIVLDNWPIWSGTLANPACPLTLTITPTLWSLLEVVPPGAVLPPHCHNSVALDLAIKGCKGGYTPMGTEIDAEGRIGAG